MAGIEILAVGDEQIAELESKTADNNNGTNANLSPAPEIEVAPVPDVPEGEQAAVEQPEVDGEVKEGAAPEHTTFWGDVPVEVEVPKEISDVLKEHKIDEAKLVAELFSKDGKFEVSEGTRKALDKAFGKTMVDGYLSLFKQQNQMFMDKHASDQQAKEAQYASNSTDFDSLVGGDQGWNELAEWAGSNLSEAELMQFNAVMTLDGEHYQAQRAVVEALQIKRLAGIGDKEGDQRVTLLSDSGGGEKPSGDALPSSLTREEFQALFTSPRYSKDKQWAAQVDSIRVATQAREKAAR